MLKFLPDPFILYWASILESDVISSCTELNQTWHEGSQQGDNTHGLYMLEIHGYPLCATLFFVRGVQWR